MFFSCFRLTALPASDAAMVQLLIDAGADVNACDQNGESPLVAVARQGGGDDVERALALTAAPDVDLSTTFSGRTALGWAVKKSRRGVVDIITHCIAVRERWKPLRATWVAACVVVAASDGCG